MLSNTLIPACYAVEKENVRKELQDVRDVAATADGWTSIAQDHYLTVLVHYVREGSMKEKVLHTRVVYTSHTGDIVAEERGDILDEFNLKDRVVAVKVDNAANMDVAVKKMSIKNNVLLCSHSQYCCSEALHNYLSLTVGRKDQSNGGVAEKIQPG